MQLKRFKDIITEKRRNPEQNPKISTIDALVALNEKDPDLFISMSDVKKVGIYPEFEYGDTPAGIYAYKLSDVIKSIQRRGFKDGLPYAGERPWVWVLKSTPNQYYKLKPKGKSPYDELAIENCFEHYLSTYVFANPKVAGAIHQNVKAKKGGMEAFQFIFYNWIDKNRYGQNSSFWYPIERLFRFYQTAHSQNLDVTTLDPNEDEELKQLIHSLPASLQGEFAHDIPSADEVVLLIVRLPEFKKMWINTFELHISSAGFYDVIKDYVQSNSQHYSDRNALATVWNKLLRQTIYPYVAVYDPGFGIIYDEEPAQCAFLTKTAFTPVDVLYNPESSKKEIDKMQRSVQKKLGKVISKKAENLKVDDIFYIHSYVNSDDLKKVLEITPVKSWTGQNRYQIKYAYINPTKSGYITSASTGMIEIKPDTIVYNIVDYKGGTK